MTCYRSSPSLGGPEVPRKSNIPSKNVLIKFEYQSKIKYLNGFSLKDDEPAKRNPAITPYQLLY